MLDRYLAAREQAIRPYLSIGSTRFHHPSADRKLQPVLPALALPFAPEGKGAALRPGRDQFHAGLEAGASP